MDDLVRVNVTSETERVAELREAAAEAARRLGFTEAEVSDMALAVGEAVCNVIKHGYAGRRGEPIELTLQPVRRGERPGLQLTLFDRGRQVDPASIVSRDLDDVRPGGIGTHIMRSIMDEVEYTLRPTGGMQLRMVKMLKPSATTIDRQDTADTGESKR